MGRWANDAVNVEFLRVFGQMMKEEERRPGRPGWSRTVEPWMAGGLEFIYFCYILYIISIIYIYIYCYSSFLSIKIYHYLDLLPVPFLTIVFLFPRDGVVEN